MSAIVEGAVNNEVTLLLKDGEQLTTVITKASSEALKLAEGKIAIALIKAPWVVLASLDCNLNFSARNQFQGKILSLTQGAVNATVHVKTTKGLDITAVITNESVESMSLKAGDDVLALIKASSVILATPKY